MKYGCEISFVQEVLCNPAIKIHSLRICIYTQRHNKLRNAYLIFLVLYHLMESIIWNAVYVSEIIYVVQYKTDLSD